MLFRSPSTRVLQCPQGKNSGRTHPLLILERPTGRRMVEICDHFLRVYHAIAFRLNHVLTNICAPFLGNSFFLLVGRRPRNPSPLRFLQEKEELGGPRTEGRGTMKEKRRKKCSVFVFVDLIITASSWLFAS